MARFPADSGRPKSPAIRIGIAAVLLLTGAAGSSGSTDRSGNPVGTGPKTPRVVWQRNGRLGRRGITLLFAEDGGIVFSSECPDESTETTLSQSTRIVARDVETGVSKWSTQIPVDSPTDSFSAVVGASPGKVFATRSSDGGAGPGHLYALDESNGGILWVSQDLVWLPGPEILSSARNGDLLIGNWDSIVRLNPSDGSTVWRLPRECAGDGACGVAVSGDKGYFWDVQFRSAVSVVDLTTGAVMYRGPSNTALEGGQNPIVLGPGGAVYVSNVESVERGGSLLALYDDGSSLSERWRIPIPYMAFSSMATGPDGFLYSYGLDHSVIRVDAATGVIVARSLLKVWPELNLVDVASMLIDSDGNVFVAASEADTYDDPSGKTVSFQGKGKVYAFTRDLVKLWSDDSMDVPGGPGMLLDPHGTLIVAGTGDVILRAYRDAVSPLRISPWIPPALAPVDGRP